MIKHILILIKLLYPRFSLKCLDIRSRIMREREGLIWLIKRQLTFKKYFYAHVEFFFYNHMRLYFFCAAS